MFSLIRFFIQLCLLRARPQDLPASPVLLWLTTAVNIGLGALISVATFGGFGASLGASALDAAVLAAFIALMLRFRNHPERFVQTLTAAMGIGALVSAIGLPLQWLVPDDPQNAGGAAQVALLLLQLLSLWVLVVLGHVLRHALDTLLPLGIGLAFAYTLISGSFIFALFMPTPS